MNAVCSICRQSFPSRNKLFMHVKTHEPSNNLVQQETVKFSLPVDELRIVYEDEDCRVVSKPQGLATMGLKGANLLKHSILLIEERLKVQGVGYKKAIPCHRLDAATGGLVLCSKSRESETALKRYFREKLILKKYVTMVPGVLPAREGFLLSKIDEKDAISYFQVVSETKSRSYETLSTVYMWPITGKNHQLRKQMKELGHPMIGDPRYSHAKQWPSVPEFNHLYLWAVELTFPSIVKSSGDITSHASEIQKEESGDEDDEDQEDDDEQDDGKGKPSLLSLTKQIISEAAEVNVGDLKKIHLIPSSLQIEQIFLSYLSSGGYSSSDIKKIEIPEPAYYEAFRQYEKV